MNDSPLVRVVEAIETLCSGGHLPLPGTIILSANKCTIMPESTTPISTLLTWVHHLDSQTKVTFEVTQLSPGLIGVNATGALDGITFIVSVTTTAPIPEAHDKWKPVPVSYMTVLEHSLSESI